MKKALTGAILILTPFFLQGQEFLKVSVDCSDCDMLHLKRELTWVEYVRDQSLSDVHIWSLDQQNGGGGKQFTVHFIGQGKLEDLQYELNYQAPKMKTRLEVQKDLSRLFSIGLLPFAVKKGQMPMVSFPSKPKQPNPENVIVDRWKKWVFDIGMNVGMDLESNQTELEVEGMMRARQTTENWRIRSELEYDFEENTVQGDNHIYKSTFKRASFEASGVRSLTEHWSAGLFTDFQNNSAKNTASAYRFNAALEYNFYPYWQSHEKEFTLAYYLGPVFIKYLEETIYGFSAENLLAQQLSIEYRLQQPWGSMDMEIDGFCYLNDMKKNRISLEAGTRIRVTKGLSLRLSGRYQMIHDQIYLPKGSASIEEILLKRKSIATDYSFDFYIGFVYTFGSIYNSIVNTRL